MAASRLIFGFHAVVSRLRQHPDSIREIYVDAGRNDQRTRSLIALAESLQVRLILCEHERLEKMTGGKRHQSVAATIDQVTLASSIDDILEYYMGKNTPSRQEFIIENLRYDLDESDGSFTEIDEKLEEAV